MDKALWARFGEATLKAPHAIQWLSDNGPQYTATASVLYAHELGLIPITTPAYSPQSNGLAEAFVKTFKRDYVDGAELRDAESVLTQLGRWIEDYNTQAPHSALGMRSPALLARSARKVLMCAVASAPGGRCPSVGFMSSMLLTPEVRRRIHGGLAAVFKYGRLDARCGRTIRARRGAQARLRSIPMAGEQRRAYFTELGRAARALLRPCRRAAPSRSACSRTLGLDPSRRRGPAQPP